ncbi:MAG: glycoside hydrolase family 113, partial [Polyangiaceae bacterium]
LALASPGADAWRRAELGGIRGVTIGPIENAYHPGVGYGSPAYDRTLSEAHAMGATWVAITPFGRVADLGGSGVDPTFESPFDRNRRDVARAIEMAHAHALRVFLVPHLWVESGEWRALIDPKTDEGWERWAESYGRFVHAWAEVAQGTGADMFSVGVELRTWVTSEHAPSMERIVDDVRRVYHGVLTYSANWDDVDDTVVLGGVDVIGINAFYPLADEEGASDATLLAGGAEVRGKVHALAERWQRPVVFTEIGYTTRPDPAVRPWEWPDAMSHPRIDERAQASAYRGLVGPLLDEPDFAGFFVWRVYADPDDVSQEAPWGFSPRGKLAETVMR